MAVAMRQSRRFAAPSPVTRYWLANCVGFSLSGGGRGTVERILADDNPHDPSWLEVRTGRRRVRRVPTSAVIAVVPSEGVLVVDHRRRRRVPDRSRDATLRLRWSLRVLQRVLVVGIGIFVALTGGLFRLGRRAWVVGSPVVARASRRSGSGAVRLVRSVPWQSYGRSARSASTRLSRDISGRLSRPRTTSSDESSEKSSSGEAGTTSST
jgi:hypothetical protein